MLKKLLFTILVINFIATTELIAGRGFGSGFGLGLLGGALVSSAAYNNTGYRPGYGYYPPQPYGYGPYNSYGYMPY